MVAAAVPIRLSPSGPPIKNAGGGSFAPGPGARLRLTESNSIMGGSLAVPSVPDVIGPGGFGTAALVLSLDNPQAELEYRAKAVLDVINTSTNVDAQVVLYLDTSVDGGVTYTNAVRNAHVVPATGNGAGVTQSARSVEINLDLFQGTAVNVVDGTTATLKLRARASLPLGTLGSVQVNSLATTGGGTPVAGLAGSIHMELEECF